MGGIAGISLRQETNREGLLSRLSECVAHRGAEGEAIYRHKGTALVQRYLHHVHDQVYTDPTNKLHMTMSGYLHSHLDRQTPLTLWQRYGTDFVKYLEGVYALAIYDEIGEELILARDAVGVKPLYVAETGSGVAFASEAGALVRAGWLAADVNPQAWPSFFNKQYVGGQYTLFKGVERVMPGEVIRIRHGKIIERVQHPLQLEAANKLTEDEALAQFDALFTQAMEAHLPSDLPYGAFLSGGVDSSCVVSKMAELASPVRTYTIGIDQASIADERANAYRLARNLRTDHRTVSFSQEDFWGLIPQMCEALDDLVVDDAMLPSLKLAAYAQDHVRVVISGDGGDEGFAGYGRYRRNGLVDLLRGRRGFRGRGLTAGYQHIFRLPEIANWRDGAKQERFDTEGFTQLQTYQAQDLSDWLPDDLLTKVDRTFMVYGIEGRVPLLDQKLLSFAFSLPDSLKLRRRQGKYLLRKWLATQHPDQNPWSPKQGFTVPTSLWLEQKREQILPYLHKHAGIEQVVVRKDLRQWLENPLDKQGAKLLFTLLNYAVWHDLYIQENPLPDALFSPPVATEDEDKVD